MTELDVVLNQMNEGFQRLHERLDRQGKEYNEHVGVCLRRFANLEQSQAVNLATGLVRERYNYWPLITKAAIGFITVAALAWLFKLTEHAGKVQP